MGLEFIDSEQAADDARQEAEEELAYAEERERELEEAEERKRKEREDEFDRGLAEYQERLAEEAALDSDREEEATPPQKQCDSCGHNLRGRGWTHRGDEVWCLPCVHQVEGKPCPTDREGKSNE